MGFVKQTLDRIALRRAAFGALPLLLFLVLAFLSAKQAAKVHSHRLPIPVALSALDSYYDAYVEIPVIGRYEPSGDVVSVGEAYGKEVYENRYCHLLLRGGMHNDDDDPVIVLAKYPCAGRTESTLCKFVLHNDTNGNSVARGWLGKAKGSAVLREANEVLKTVEETKEQKKLRKKLEKIRLPLVLDASRSAPSVGATVSCALMAMAFLALSVLTAWWFAPRNYRTSPMYLRLARLGRTVRGATSSLRPSSNAAAEVEAEIDAEVASKDPEPLHLPGSIMSISYMIFPKMLELKVHFLGDIESCKQAVIPAHSGLRSLLLYNKRGELMFALHFADAQSLLEGMYDLMIRRDMVRESARWRETARPKSKPRPKGDTGPSPDEERRRREATSAENYKVLSLSQGASKEDVLKAWRKIALKWHPDRHHNPEAKTKAEPIFRRATQAKEELMALLEDKEESSKDK